jgi:hypothetical protein
MNLDSSDIVAIVAVVVSAFVSVVSAYISYKNNRADLDASQQNNRANILSKRTEFIFEKQIAIFKEVALKMDQIIAVVVNGAEQQGKKTSNEKLEEKFFSDLEKASDALLWFFNGEKFYLPEKVLLSTTEFIAAIKEFIDKRDYKNKHDLLEFLVPKNLEITGLMRIYWGIDDK